MTGGGDGGRPRCPPHRRDPEEEEMDGAGRKKKKRLRGRRGNRIRRLLGAPAPAGPCLPPSLLPSQRGSPAEGSGEPPRGARPPLSTAGWARLAHAAAGQRSSGRSPPAALNYSWGVDYIRSHKLEPLCNAIRERSARPLLLLLGSRSLGAPAAPGITFPLSSRLFAWGFIEKTKII